MKNLERSSDVVNTAEIAETFNKYRQKLKDIENARYQKQGEAHKFFKQNSELILERLRKIISPKLAADDLQFDEEWIRGDAFVVKINSIAGYVPDEGVFPTGIDIPMPDLEKIKGELENSIKDLGLEAQLDLGFYGK